MEPYPTMDRPHEVKFLLGWGQTQEMFETVWMTILPKTVQFGFARFACATPLSNGHTWIAIVVPNSYASLTADLMPQSMTRWLAEFVSCVMPVHMVDLTRHIDK